MRNPSAPSAAIAALSAHRHQFSDRNSLVPSLRRKATQPPRSMLRATIRSASLHTSKPQLQTVIPACTFSPTSHHTLPTSLGIINNSNSCHARLHPHQTRLKTSSKITFRLAPTNTQLAIRKNYFNTRAQHGMIRPRWSTDVCTKRGTGVATRNTWRARTSSRSGTGTSAATSREAELDATKRGKWRENYRRHHHHRHRLRQAPAPSGGSRVSMLEGGWLRRRFFPDG